MSDSNKSTDGMQNYLDLLQDISEESVKELKNYGIIEEKKPLPPPIKEKNLKVAAEDISSFSEKEKNPFKRLAKWYNNLPKKKKIVVSVVAVILAIVIALTASLGVFVINKFGLLGDNINGSEEYDDVIYDEDEFKNIEIDIGSASFKQALTEWATTGNDQHMSSKNVINVLLVGADTKNNAGNTDVMMLVSLNKKTKQLKMVSFLRDSYLYVDSAKGSYCTKLNAAFSMGGPECLMQTIENNYKIKIDNYVMVNFASFVAIIDAMGGVTVDVQKYEADYNYKKFKVELPYGDNVTLDGKQALCFCRIRGCDADGDVSRTRRQRQVIDSIIDRVTNASISDLNKYLDILLPYVDTGYSEGQILSLGIKAITGKWFNYERSQHQMPDEECRTSGSANAWIWVVDYELAAHKLQMELYGQSNIPINEDRTSIIDVYRGANYTGISSNSNSSSGNNTLTTTEVPVTENNNIPTTEPESSLNQDETELSTEPVSQDDTTGISETVSETNTAVTESEITTTEAADTTQAASTTNAPAPTETEAVTVNE